MGICDGKGQQHVAGINRDLANLEQLINVHAESSIMRLKKGQVGLEFVMPSLEVFVRRDVQLNWHLKSMTDDMGTVCFQGSPC